MVLCFIHRSYLLGAVIREVFSIFLLHSFDFQARFLQIHEQNRHNQPRVEPISEEDKCNEIEEPVHAQMIVVFLKYYRSWLTGSFLSCETIWNEYACSY